MPPQDGPCAIVERLHCCLTQTEPASENGLHSRSGLKVRSSPLLLGASGLTLFSLYQLVDFRSAVMVSETSASEDGSLKERLRSGKPSSRSGRIRVPKELPARNEREPYGLISRRREAVPSAS